MGRKPGRPRWVPDGVVVQTAKQYAQWGATRDQIAHALGIAPATLYQYVADHPSSEFSEALKKGKAEAVIFVAGKLYSQAISDTDSGRTAARIFYLKAQGQWSERHQLEVGGADPEKPELRQPPKPLTPGEVREMLDALTKLDAKPSKADGAGSRVTRGKPKP